MSAPDTNPRKQAWQHRGPLLGVALAVLIGVSMLLFWLFDEVSQAENPAVNDAGVPADVETAPTVPDPAATDPLPPVTEPTATGETRPSESAAPQPAPSGSATQP